MKKHKMENKKAYNFVIKLSDEQIAILMYIHAHKSLYYKNTWDTFAILDLLESGLIYEQQLKWEGSEYYLTGIGWMIINQYIDNP